MAAVHDVSASQPGISAGQAAMVSCWLCGIRLRGSQMIADGGEACDDIRWYCSDVLACTQRLAARPLRDRREPEELAARAAGEALPGEAAP